MFEFYVEECVDIETYLRGHRYIFEFYFEKCWASELFGCKHAMEASISQVTYLQ